jgi:hypothetical protein
MPFIKKKKGPEDQFYHDLYEKLKESGGITYIEKKKRYTPKEKR